MQRRKLVDNKWVTFLEDKFQLPNGADCTYYHAQKSDAVMAIVVDGDKSDGYTYIVNQHRHPIGKTIWQFPIGGFDASTEDPVDAARKELREETGVVAGDMHFLGSFYADPGFTNQKLHVCATNNIVDIVDQKLESSEHGLVSKKVRISSINALIESGEMGDAWGIVGCYHLHRFLAWTIHESGVFMNNPG
jgi:ADP-ribose pyrophosphatase YjhB (NUDIX family)